LHLVGSLYNTKVQCNEHRDTQLNSFQNSLYPPVINNPIFIFTTLLTRFRRNYFRYISYSLMVYRQYWGVWNTFMSVACWN